MLIRFILELLSAWSLLTSRLKIAVPWLLSLTTALSLPRFHALFELFQLFIQGRAEDASTYRIEN